MAKQSKQREEVLLRKEDDRRSFEWIPPVDGKRKYGTRRGTKYDSQAEFNEKVKCLYQGMRYAVDYPVRVAFKENQTTRVCQAKAKNLSGSGMLISLSPEDGARFTVGTELKLHFTITPGSMPEGYEMPVHMKATIVRLSEEDGRINCALIFAKNLSDYQNIHRGRYKFSIAMIFLFVVTLAVILMRTESVVYFKFNKTLYLYSIITAIFLLSRYVFALFYRPIKVDTTFTPGVSIIIPCFNEEKWIQRTIMGCLNQNYPIDKLEVIVVDDCSTDRSVEKIQELYGQLAVLEQYKMKERLHYICRSRNTGKREVMAAGVKVAKHDLVVFVDSDSFLEPFAIINLVQPFKDTDMGGVSGRTDIANTYTNALTKMQAVRYYIAFRVMKAAEGYFDTVTCLSGPLSCYRKKWVEENLDAWLGQTFLGQRATFGDDRSMTNLILKNHRTAYQDTAVCKTIVPSTYDVFLKQQMRWKRSWLRESLLAGKYMWKKEPFSSLSFYMGLIVPLIAPVVVLYNLIWVPLAHRVFPTTFLLGMLLMALLMSFAQLLLRKSTTWIYGIWFCLYYEFVLLWQMPIAWVTFWKSTWGTRMTPADVAEKEKSAEEKHGLGAE